WSYLKGENYDLAQADNRTPSLPPVITNYEVPQGMSPPRYLYGQEALGKITVPEGYNIELFASEREFPDLANPVQISFDNQGRLWVAVMPSYPHYRPGDDRPNDKLLILEDTDQDGKADRQIVFADSLHLPIGFELAPEGVYISQGTHLMLLSDTDGDDQADHREILLSGFDDHDTHHAISAFCADPSGAIYMGEGIFLHSNVETAYGPVRASWGGFMRFNPQRRQLENTAQISIPNPWGIAFDDWGQPFYAETSNPNVRWMLPSTIAPRYGVFAPLGPQLIEKDHQVRPTSGLEFLHSRHFPAEMQGDLLINNTIGYLGTKQHRVWDDTTGFLTEHRQDLIRSDDPNFRPVDLEIAPDGSLYIADWHNVLIGHMQHNARDPLRDHVHGRIYRLTCKDRPLVEPAVIAGASLEQLFENLKLPEYRSRYRSRRELRGRTPAEVLNYLTNWVEGLDKNDPGYEHHLLEALWVSWGANQIDLNLLQRCLFGEDYRLRAAATTVLRYSGHQIVDQEDFILAAASDPHPRVRLAGVVAASWLADGAGRQIISLANQQPKQAWVAEIYRAALAHSSGVDYIPATQETPPALLASEKLAVFELGREIYERDGSCSTCHQPDGLGLSAADYPPLAGTRWANGDEERLIKLTLHGLIGPVEVDGRTYPGQVPMTPYGKLLSDEEVAAVLTYVRNSFGNSASSIETETVARVREATASRNAYYQAEELLNEHPFPALNQ
ncbi:MAG: PVC-type heme-binding CxxCH protein, partial [Bacteroidota bacterium]